MAYCPQWFSSMDATAPWRVMASATVAAPCREPGMALSRKKPWVPSVAGSTMTSLAVTAAAPPRARSS